MKGGLGVAAGLLLVCGVGLAGYLIGESKAPTTEEAATARDGAFQAAAREAERGARETGLERGRTEGLQDGDRQGHRAGISDGTKAGDQEAAERDAAAAAQTQQETAPQETVPQDPAAALPDYATTPGGELICDGAIANDAHYQACLEQSSP